MQQQIKRRAGAIAASGLATAALWALAQGRALAQETATGPVRSRLGLWEGLLSTLIYGVVGIVLAILGFKLFDWVIRHNIEEEIFVNKNMAAAILAGAVVLGVSLIVAATILS